MEKVYQLIPTLAKTKDKVFSCMGLAALLSSLHDG
jgi:hypothetical protein